MVVEETDDQLKMNLLKPDSVESIKKSAIENRRIADVSSIPKGLLDTFSADEIMDLLAFLQSNGATH